MLIQAFLDVGRRLVLIRRQRGGNPEGGAGRGSGMLGRLSLPIQWCRHKAAGWVYCPVPTRGQR